MPTMIQIRNVPDEVHRKVKARAAMAGMSLSSYLLREIERIVEQPTREELLARIARHEPLDLQPSPEEILREERERR